MFHFIRAGAGRILGPLKAFSILVLSLSVFAGLLLWSVAHYEFGFYLDREHSKGSRIYRVNSYEQFMKRRMGETTMEMVV